MATNTMNKKYINKRVLALPNKHRFSVKNILSWIKTQQEIASQCHKQTFNLKGIKQLKIQAKQKNADVYIREMRSYLRTGLWTNGACGQLFFGKLEEERTKGDYFEA